MSTREKIQAVAVVALMIGIDLFLGLRGSWWMVVFPGFLLGWFTRERATGLAILSVGLVWIAAALVVDAPTGFRLSMRIAGVMALPTFLSAYLVTVLVAITLAGLGAHAGRCLRTLLLSRGQAPN